MEVESSIFGLPKQRTSQEASLGGMAIRNMGVVAFTAFACSLAASLKHMATIFPEWVKLGQKGELLQISRDASPAAGK